MSIINSKSNTDFSAIYIRYNSGALRETPGYFGISHLIEHLLCKGIDHLQDELQANGIAHNAYTSNNDVVFYMNGLEEYLAPLREDFIKLITGFEFTREQFELERKIVLEEYDEYMAQQDYAHSLNHDRVHHGIYNALGLRSDIENITYEQCLQFRRKNFEAPSEIVNISKAFVLGDVYKTKSYNTNFQFIPQPNAPTENRAEFKDKTSIIYELPRVGENVPEIGLICRMLTSGLNSPLHQEVREKRGMAYGVSGCAPRVDNCVMPMFSVSTSNNKVQECIDVIKDVINNPEIHMTRERFEIIRKASVVSEKKEQALNHGSGSFGILLCKATKPDWYKQASDFTYEEVMAVYKKHFLHTPLITTDKDFI